MWLAHLPGGASAVRSVLRVQAEETLGWQRGRRGKLSGQQAAEVVFKYLHALLASDVPSSDNCGDLGASLLMFFPCVALIESCAVFAEMHSMPLTCRSFATSAIRSGCLCSATFLLPQLVCVGLLMCYGSPSQLKHFAAFGTPRTMSSGFLSASSLSDQVAVLLRC